MKVNDGCRVLPLLLFSFLLVPGCNSRTAGNKPVLLSGAEFSGPDTIQVPYNQSVQIGETAQSLRFDTLFRDSRCPEDVNCIWKGAWEIGMELMDRDIIHSLILGTYLKTTRDTTLAGYRIQVLDLLPRPNSTVKHTKSDYRAVVVIHKSPSAPPPAGDK
jgi:hypothetical protein